MFRLHRILITATVLFAAAGCVDEIIDIPVVEDTVVGEGGTVSGLVPMTISAIETKTTLSGTTVKWSANDKVAVFDLDSEKREFSAGTISGDGTSAEFSGKVTVGTTDFYAVYPYSLAQTEASGVLTVTLPSDQTYKNGSFADNHNIAVAKGTAVTEGSGAYSGDLVSPVSFKNVCGLLKFTVPDHIAVARKIKIESSSANIAGTMSINYSGTTPSASIKADGSKDVTISGEFASGSTCYFVVAPGSLGTIKVTVSSADNELYAKQSTKSLTIAAGQIIDLGDIDFVTTPACEAFHTYSYGRLLGTGVNFSLGIGDALAQQISSISLNINGGDSFSKTITMSGAGCAIGNFAILSPGDKIFLPRSFGEYEITGTYVMNGQTLQIPATTFTPDALNADKLYDSFTFSVSAEHSDSGDEFNNSLISNTITDKTGILDKYIELEINSVKWENSKEVSPLTPTLSTLTSKNFSCCMIKGNYTITGNVVVDGVTVSMNGSCEIRAPKLNITPQGKIVHTVNSSNELSGSKLTAWLILPDGFSWAENIISVDYTLTDGSNTLRQSTGSINNSIIEVANNWIYIPNKGKTYTLSSASDQITINNSQTLTAPVPAFTVTSSKSYTSYDEYAGQNGITKSINNANSRDPETIYNVGGSWTISTEIMQNDKYSKTVSISGPNTNISKSDCTTNSHNIGNISDLTTWGEYTVSTTVVFDGVTKSASKTHHITGLPYRAVPNTGDGWTSNKGIGAGINTVNWKNDHVYLEGSSKKQSIYSPAFHIPETINIKLNVPITLRCYAALSIWALPEFSCSIGGQQIMYKKGEKGETSWGSANIQTYYALTANHTMSNSSNTITMENLYTMTEAWVKIYTIELLYR